MLPHPAPSADPLQAYARLHARFARIATLGEASELLNWDAAAIMPAGGAAARGDQLAVLAGLAHALLTEAAAASDLEAADEASAASDPWAAANLRLMRARHRRATAVPATLVEARARAHRACEAVWRGARAAADFDRVAPHLEEVVALAREHARALGAALGIDPYDALMDEWQPGATAAGVEPVFARYEAFLAEALPEALARQAKAPQPVPLSGHFPSELQERMCRELASRCGLDFAHARLDRSAHPFCSGTAADLRITTRYDETDPAGALMAVLHETGHALYESGLPAEWARQPVGAAAGMAVHESQSLIVEMMACRSDAYLGWLAGELTRAFGVSGPAWAPANLARLWRRVARSFIRVDADEMTYPAHVILRFRLERALIGGALDVRDLPAAWAEGMRALLGIVPPDDAQGCLQDIHWYEGIFGYFPSYTLGAMGAAQLMAAAGRAVPGLDQALGRGDLGPLVGWLRERVHGQGSLHPSFDALLVHATGKPLDPADFEQHLRTRYLT